MAQILELKRKLKHPLEHAEAEHKNAVAYCYTILAIIRDSQDDQMMYDHAKGMLLHAIDRRNASLSRLRELRDVTA